MVRKKKMCAGFDGKKHEDYIYKNIDGKKYCKSCAFKLQPPKQIRKVSQKQVFKMTLKKELIEEDKKFYMKVWRSRFFREHVNIPNTFYLAHKPKCECCQTALSDEPNLTYFHHILEKRNYPHLRHEEENIAIVCSECHNRYEQFPDKVPYLVKRKEILMKKFLNQ
jgi:hypothetical protein